METLTIEEILAQSSMKKATIIAGRKGLSKQVRWVHILEVNDFSKLIHGKECILTTGMGMKHSNISQKDYIQQLIQVGAACVIIELGSSVEEIEEEALLIAEEYSFPIGIFPEEVRFVDITQELNSLLINHHHKNLQLLDRVSQHLNELTLKSNASHQIAEFLYKWTKKDIVYYSLNDTPIIYPKENKNALPYSINNIIEGSTKIQNNSNSFIAKEIRGTNYIFKWIELVGQKWGLIGMEVKKEEFNELTKLIMDRAALAIGQFTHRIQYQEEQNLLVEQSWINDLIHQKISNEKQAISKITHLLQGTEKIFYRIIVVSTDSNKLENAFTEGVQYHIILALRAYFQNKNLHSFICRTKGNQIITLVIGIEEESLHAEQLHGLNEAVIKGEEHPRLGVSQVYKSLTKAYMAYQEAEQMIQIGKRSEDGSASFFDCSGVLQILLNVRQEYVTQFIDQQIGPLINGNIKENAHLLYTLRIYLQKNCIKKETAEHLHVARQTVYQRLAKIEDLLKCDITKSYKKRISIELALEAYDLYRYTS